MKVTLRNLVYGLLVLGLPVVALANDGVKADIRSSDRNATTEQASVMRIDIGLEGLEGAVLALTDHQEVLRESLRAWTDAAEAAQMRRNSVQPLAYVVLARN